MILQFSSLLLGSLWSHWIFFSVQGQSCSSIRRRREWRQLNPKSQESFVSALKCLATQPSSIQNATTAIPLRLYDDFNFLHSSVLPKIHFVAMFLPWHRHFVHRMQAALEQCGYEDGIPRWDWSLDAANLSASPVWSSDPNVGFGTNGVGPHDPAPEGVDGGQVMDGAFANFELRHPQRHFLHRQWNELKDLSVNGSIFGSQYFDTKAVDQILALESFASFRVAIEGQNPLLFKFPEPGPHGTIHSVIGGDMAYLPASANEMLFWLHHCNIDWIWWRWQQADPRRRNDYSGNILRNKDDNRATLDDEMEFLGLGHAPNPKVRDVMDTAKFPYCYTYE